MSEGAVTARLPGAAAHLAPRVIPGAPPPQPLTKSQIRKRKKTSAAKFKMETDETSAGLDLVETPREAALVDHVPSAIVDTLVATTEENQANHSTDTPSATEKPASPLIDLVVNKRIKHFAKKLQRIHLYSSNPPETLNDDQKNAIQTIPHLEAVIRELEEIKKLIEAQETSQAAKLAAERAAEAESTEQRIIEAAKFAEARHVTHTRSLLAFLALSTLLAAPIPANGTKIGDHLIPSDETEKLTVVDAGKTLLTPEFGAEKEGLLKALLGVQQEGTFGGISYDRLRQIAAQFIHPTTPIPSAPATPLLAPTTNGTMESTSIKFTALGSSLSREPTPTPQTPPVQAVTGASFSSMPMSGSFQFMSASDLDLDPSNDITEQETLPAPPNEWVHVEQIQSAPSFGISAEDVVQPPTVLSGEAEKLAQEFQELQVQTRATEVAITETSPPQIATATLDWAAADENDSGLPSIDSLEQQFGKSGAATPNSQFASGAATPAKPAVASEEPSTEKQPNGPAVPLDERQPTAPRSHGGRGGRGGRGRYGWGPPSETDADGFVSTGSRRGRGFRGGGERGRGGFRGGEFGHRGGYRGGERGGYRGGEGRNTPGEQRGDGSDAPGTPPPHNDGFRGRRGGRGGYRGWSEEDGGRGRGRGRGPRGRGDDSRGGAPGPAPSS